MASTPTVPDAVMATATALERIARLEPRIGAFSAFDPALARAAAEAAPDGPLAGVTLGVKDIVATASYPTGYGSQIYAGHRTGHDAACVALLEAAGAVTLGKTVTTEFAFFRPGRTRNPHDPTRTPGGSSSGSAAAVACGMVSLALGSQTAASLTRPASFCGVVGFKPSFGRYSLAGVKELARSFDTLGVLAADVALVAAADAVLSGSTVAPDRSTTPTGRIGLCRTPWWNRADPATQQGLLQAARLFAATGATVDDVDLSGFAAAAELHATIMSFEAAQALAYEHRHAADALSTQILGLIEAGRAVRFADYRRALADAAALRDRIEAVFDRHALLLAPAAPGEAPSGLEQTGDPIFSRMWTLLRLPTITLPGLAGPAGLPVGVQLLGRLGDDEAVLGNARWAERALPARPLPAIAA